ncbi:MAG: hypothetical protein JST15_08915, partial [Bacteroidetes bacterium]|nr:hypothetical protein [Bacteroidota bacterium]
MFKQRFFKIESLTVLVLIFVICGNCLLYGSNSFQRKTFDGLNTGDQFGKRVATAGDVNNDDYDNFVMCSPLNDING